LKRKRGLKAVLNPLEAIRARKVRKRRSALREYYRMAELWLPPRSTKRQFRFAIERGSELRFTKVKDRIYSIEVLRKWLIREAPAHAYYTTSMWLDPQNLGPKRYKGKRAGYEFAHNVFLGQELYFDIDAPGDLDAAKRHLLALVDLMKGEFGFKELLAVFSGSKGFHLHVYDFRPESFGYEFQCDPRERERVNQDSKVRFVESALAKDIAIDVEITLDTRRIIRLPGTVHGKTFYLCEFVPLHKVEQYRPRRIPQ
jgi:DNA primase catalytic subunit